MNLATPDHFLKYADFFFYSIGIKSHERTEGTSYPRLMNLIFFLGMGNLLFVVFFEMSFIVEGLQSDETRMVAILNMSYMGFGSLALSKMAYIYWRRADMTKCIRELEALFPYKVQEQKKYNLPKYLKLCTNISFGFSMLNMAMIWFYNLYDILNYLIANRLLHISNAEKKLNYYVRIPWDYKDNWSFYWLYLSLTFSGYTSAAGQISSDLLLFAIASQVIMHYDYIASSIENYDLRNNRENSSEEDKNDDMKFIGNMVSYHEKILSLSDLMNTIFGVPLLINFFSTALVFCVLGFHMTIGVHQDLLVKLPMFLLSTLSQISFFSHFGQELMDASENIADAVYNHNWSNSELRYRKMLVIMAQRAQRPALLKATFFLDVSRLTMTDVIQLSYKFFTLLRTLYA